MYNTQHCRGDLWGGGGLPVPIATLRCPYHNIIYVHYHSNNNTPPSPAGRVYVRTPVGWGYTARTCHPGRTYVTVRHCVYDVFANLYSGPHMIQYMQQGMALLGGGKGLGWAQSRY